MTILNRADIAGSVVVSVQFWESETKDNLQGEIERTVSLGAQSAEDVTIMANPPTEETSWASGKVTEQECQYR